MSETTLAELQEANDLLLRRLEHAEEALRNEQADRLRAEKSLEQNEFTFRLLAETLLDIVFTMQADGTCDFISDRFYETTNQTAGSGLGEGWLSSFHPEDLKRVQTEWRSALASGTPLESRYRLRTAEGAFRQFIYRIHPVAGENGRIGRWVGTASDVHDVLQTEDVLRDTSKQKEEFLSMLVHDLRNPLVPIQNALDLLRLPALDGSLKKRAIEILDRQVHELRHVLDDLLDACRLMRGKVAVDKKPVLCADVIARAVELSRPHTEQKKHRLNVTLPTEPIWLEGDFNRLAQVFANLLDNAARFTNAGGQINLAATVCAGHLVLQVRDNGIGIPRELLPHVFDLFTGGGGFRDRLGCGLGIGLAIVRKVVELHGGTVEATSDGADCGTEFTVCLPLLPDFERTSMDKGVSMEPLQDPARRILILADNPDFAEEWSMLLKVGGHEVRVAQNDADAVALAETFRPDVVSLEIGTPSLDRYEIGQRLKQVAGMENVVVIAISAYADAAHCQRAQEGGCDCLLLKPIKARDFLEHIAGKVVQR